MIALLLLSLFSSPSHATTLGEFAAMETLGHEIGAWVNNLNPAPSSTTIFSVEMNQPLEERLKPIFLTDLTREITQSKKIKVFQCSECHAPRLHVEGDRLIVTKDALDQSDLVELGKQIGTDSFMKIVLFRSSFSIMAQATLISAKDGEMIAAESFKIPNLDFSDASVQMTIGVGPAFGFSGTSLNGGNSFPLNANLSIMEEVGIGKGGLAIGGFFGFERINPIYVAPSIAFRNQFANSRLYGLTHIDLGYGYSSVDKGVIANLGYYLFLSSFSFVHASTFFMIPAIGGGGSGQFVSAGSVDIGFSLGK